MVVWREDDGLKKGRRIKKEKTGDRENCIENSVKRLTCFFLGFKKIQFFNESQSFGGGGGGGYRHDIVFFFHLKRCAMCI